jgi:hypothetical protein
MDAEEQNRIAKEILTLDQRLACARRGWSDWLLTLLMLGLGVAMLIVVGVMRTWLGYYGFGSEINFLEHMQANCAMWRLTVMALAGLAGGLILCGFALIRLHRRQDALIELLGEEALRQRAVTAIRDGDRRLDAAAKALADQLGTKP